MNYFFPMKEEAANAVVEGLRLAGVNFVAYMPDSDFAIAQKRVIQDGNFKCVPISNEVTGVTVCVGAWLGGLKPALLIPNSGLIVAAWPLVSLCMAYETPLMLVIPYRGDIGDAFWYMGPYTFTTEPLLKTLQIPYHLVEKIGDIQKSIVDAYLSTSSWLKPVAVLLTGETLW
jgi:sulfopyruvate decarboxylase subunit alpha